MVWIWVGFIALVLLLLALDLGVLHRKEHQPTFAGSLGWTAFWVVLALLFNVAIYFIYEHNWMGIASGSGEVLTGGKAALQFLTGYLVEKSLSVDNIFVIAMIFAYFRVPPTYQHRVLFWGILGALGLRLVMILAGAALMKAFVWTVYLFGGLLLFTAAKMLVDRHDNLEPDKNPIVILVRRWIPIAEDFEGSRFLTKVEGKTVATPLFLVLVLVESSDVLFAIDSIPAIFAITSDPFLVFTSNIFAILGLRSLYFALAGLMGKFRFLKTSLVFLLAFIGVKLMLSHHYPIPTWVSLSFIVGILVVGVVASLLWSNRDTAPLSSPLVEEVVEP